MLVGYVRSAQQGEVSAAEGASLRDAGCELVFADSCVGTAAEQQPELGKALDRLGPQDVLLVTGLDRLAGDLSELIARMVQVQAKGACVRTLQLQGAIEPGSTNAKVLLDALLSFDAQRASARKRQKANNLVEAHTEDGQRPRLLDDAAERLVASRAQAGEPAPKIARSIGVSARERRRALRADDKRKQ
jgi:DNA invertase Pin-like site-specific DNA recombinase